MFLPAGIAQQQRQHGGGASPLLTGLVSWWALDDDPATTCIDAHGTNDLTVVGVIGSTTTAIQGRAFDMDGDHCAINPSGTGLDTTGAFSIGGWVRWDTTNAGTWSAIAFRGTSSAGTTATRDFTLGCFNGGGISMWAYNSASEGVTSPVSRTNGAYYFAVGMYDPAGPSALISVNGEVLQSNGLSNPINSNNTHFALGRGPISGASANWDINGQLDECFFYNRLLAQSEIDWLYNSGAGRQYSDL